MNKHTISGHWKEIKAKLTEQWGKLTNDDVTKMRGTFEELEGKLEKAYGYTKEEADEQISRFVHKHGWDKDTWEKK